MGVVTSQLEIDFDVVVLASLHKATTLSLRISLVNPSLSRKSLKFRFLIFLYNCKIIIEENLESHTPAIFTSKMND